MTNATPLTLLDQLATETILDIFEYLSCNDIIYTFFYFNQRFNSILLHHQCCLSNLQTPTTDFYFWENILSIIGSQIQCLIITTIDFSFSFDLFPNLKSIVISSPFPIVNDRLYSILKSEQCKKLNSFKIKSEIFRRQNKYKYLQNDLFKQLFHTDNSLKTFECLSQFYSDDFEMIDNWQINENIHSLSLRIDNCMYAFSLLVYTPNLKSYKLIVSSIPLRPTLNEELDLSKIKLEKLDFTYEPYNTNYEVNGHHFRILTNLIKQFSSSLICLSIDLSRRYITESDTFHFNGILLQEQLLEPMIQLKRFHLYGEFEKQPFAIENILSTFKNQFWFDHNWSIGMHKRYLYTLPFYFDKVKDFIDFDHIESSNPMMLPSSQTWYNIKSIDFQESYLLNLNLLKQLKMKMPNLITITFTSFSSCRLDIMEDFDTNEDAIIKTNITLDSVTTVCFRGTFIERFQQWLINVLPNLKHLVLPITYDFVPTVYNKIERLKLREVTVLNVWEKASNVYFPNLEYVEIELSHRRSYDFMKILKSFSHCKTLMLYFPSFRNYDGNSREIDLSKMIGELDLIEILQNYHIKHGYYCFEFTRKNNE